MRDRRRPFWYLTRRRDERQADVDEELRAHLDMRTDELVARGMPRQAARAEALRQFGDLEYTRRYCRHQDDRKETGMRWRLFVDELRQDLRYSIRALRASRGFTAVAVLTLAIGIGANTAIFSVVNAVLLRPVATAEPDRLLVIRQDLPGLDLMDTALAPPEIIDLAALTIVFAGVGGYQPTAWNLTGSGTPVRVEGAVTLGEFFGAFLQRPHLGRLYTADDSTNGNHNVAVLSHGAWLQHTGGDTSIIGRTIQLDGRAVEVVGVLEAGFEYPRNAQIYRPLNLTPQALQNRGRLIMTGLARLQPGVTHAQAAAQLDAEAKRLNEQFHGGSSEKAFRALPLPEHLAGRLRLVLLILMGAVLFVLLIACANVGSLQLVRTGRRTREVAVRAALGAGRGRIVRQLLVEGALLAAAGGALGLWLGTSTIALLAEWGPTQASLDNVGLDSRVLAFTAVISIVAAVAFGVVPALRATRVDLQGVLRDDSRGAAGSLGRRRLLQGSVVVQVALALVLLIGSGLIIQSVARLLGTGVGFAPRQVVTAQVSLPAATYGTVAQQTAFYDAVLDRLRAMPGIEAASVAWALPFSDQVRDSSRFDIAGRPAQPGEPERHAEYRVVGGDYFTTMDIPLVRGRTFDSRDDRSDPSRMAVLIDQHFAEQFFPGEDPVGHRISHARGTATIIGVVGTVDHEEIGERRKALSYYHYRQTWSGWMAIAVRSPHDVATTAAMMRASVREVDPELPLYDVATMEQRVLQSVADRRLAVAALGGFAALSLLLAMLGVYGVVRYSTSQRTQEIGIRLALGASRGRVIRMVVGDGMWMMAAGVVIGVAAAVAATRVMEGILFGIGARDPLTFAAVTALVFAVALPAVLLPARQAARVQPIVAMRAD